MGDVVNTMLDTLTSKNFYAVLCDWFLWRTLLNKIPASHGIQRQIIPADKYFRSCPTYAKVYVVAGK